MVSAQLGIWRFNTETEMAPVDSFFDIEILSMCTINIYKFDFMKKSIEETVKFCKTNEGGCYQPPLGLLFVKNRRGLIRLMII